MGLLDIMRRPNVYVINRGVPYSEIVNGLDISELYRTQASLRAVVSFLADSVGQLPLHCYVRESDNDRVRDTQSTLAQLIAHPGADMTQFELMRDTTSDILLYGWATWLVIPDRATATGWSITHIPTSWFNDVTTMDGFTPTEYTFTNPKTQKRVTLPAEDFIRFRNYGPNGQLDPVSPIDSLKPIIEEQLASMRYRRQVWKNGGQVGQFITRPKDAPPWGDGGRERFAKSWKAKFAGQDGTDTGGTPLLEDGMELKSLQFNAKDAQWMESIKLSREDVAAAYHVNPSLIWHSDSQTYASAKDNARALYSDALGPVLEMIQDRVTTFLVPKLGADEKTYLEFKLDAKLQGSFEERASVIQSATGRPWMLVDEARSMMNLPKVEGGDELCVPLNVTVGGLASPNDTDPTIERYSDDTVCQKSVQLKSRGTADESSSDAITECLRKFFKRQSSKVLGMIGQDEKADGEWPKWWNADRWNRELADDLYPLLLEQVTAQAKRTLRDIELNPNDYRSEATEHYIKAMAEGKAKAINNVTYRQLVAALEADDDSDAVGSTPKGVFELAQTDRAERAGVSFATAAAGWACLEAVRQCAPNRGATKTWIVTSGNPRPEHAAMDGETVPYGEEFSNGAKWPGDQVLTPDESCNCMCQVEITIG